MRPNQQIIGNTVFLALSLVLCSAAWPAAPEAASGETSATTRSIFSVEATASYDSNPDLASSQEDSRSRDDVRTEPAARGQLQRPLWRAWALGVSGAHAGGALRAGRLIASPSNVATLVVGGALAAASHTWDQELLGEAEGLWPLEATTDLTDLYGSSTLNLPASLILWSAGCLSQRPALRSTGADLTRTLVMVQALVGPVKLLTRRERPDGSNRRSFPSGHSANAFAMARLAHLRHGARLGLPLYAVSVLTAAGRLGGDRHYLSDVVMGAATGIVVANCVVWGYGTRRRVSLAPLSGGRGLSVTWLLH
jgi:membrane-associated phospholipid phosphatase